MELVGTLFAGMIGSAATVGPGIAGAATVLAPATSGLSMLSGLATAASVVGSIGSGLAGMAAGKAEAKEHEFASRDEYIAGKETSAALKQELAKTLGDQAVGFAAGGVDLGSVSVQAAKRQAIDDAEKELSIASNDALSRSLARRRAARNARSKGSWSLFRGALQGVSTGANAAMSWAEI